MAINLKKNQNVSVDHTNPVLSSLTFGCGWDVRTTNDASFDLDMCAFLLDDDNMVRSDDDFIFYNQLKSKCGSVIHKGDNTDGTGNGDDEQIIVNLSLIPETVKKIVFVVSIHNAMRRRQHFGMVKNAYMRIVSNKTGTELLKFDLSEDSSNYQSVVFGELYKRDNQWKFKALGQGYNFEIGAIARKFGVDC